MSSIITRGLGPGPGLVTKGYGGFALFVQTIYGYFKRLWWEKGKKLFQIEIPIYGDTVHLLFIEEKIYGDLNTTIVVSNKFGFFGDFVDKKSQNLQETKICGDTIQILNENISLKGKKDFKKILWELLIDE